MTKDHPPLTIDSQIVRLRGHHLLCMLTWSGVGYSPEFTEKFEEIVKNVKNGGEIHIVTGIDDVCFTLCPHKTPDYHCLNDSVIQRDTIAIEAINNHLGTLWSKDKSIILTENMLNELRLYFKTGDLRVACQGCEWYSFCTDIANDDFAKSTFLKG